MSVFLITRDGIAWDHVKFIFPIIERHKLPWNQSSDDKTWKLFTHLKASVFLAHGFISPFMKFKYLNQVSKMDLPYGDIVSRNILPFSQDALSQSSRGIG